MCFFKKKKGEPITGNKYALEQFVRFRYRGELSHGYIYAIKKSEDGHIIYDIQIGGECPAIIRGIGEEDIVKEKRA